MPPCGWRPFLGENRGGCPLTPDFLGRGRPLISRALGAARGPFTVALSTRIRFAFRPAAPAGNRPLVVGAQGGRGAGGDAGGPDLPDDDPLAAGAGRPAAGVRRDPGGHGGNLGLLEAGGAPRGSTCPG